MLISVVAPLASFKLLAFVGPGRRRDVPAGHRLSGHPAHQDPVVIDPLHSAA